MAVKTMFLYFLDIFVYEMRQRHDLSAVGAEGFVKLAEICVNPFSATSPGYFFSLVADLKLMTD